MGPQLRSGQGPSIAAPFSLRVRASDSGWPASPVLAFLLTPILALPPRVNPVEIRLNLANAEVRQALSLSPTAPAASHPRSHKPVSGDACGGAAMWYHRCVPRPNKPNAVSMTHRRYQRSLLLLWALYCDQRNCVAWPAEEFQSGLDPPAPAPVTVSDARALVQRQRPAAVPYRR